MQWVLDLGTAIGHSVRLPVELSALSVSLVHATGPPGVDDTLSLAKPG
jgi:hypothetical protein